jgi:hypothetical protein
MRLAVDLGDVMMFRIRYERQGAHVHCMLFAGLAGATFANCGKLIMSIAEFDSFKEKATFIDFRDGMEVSDAAMR